MFVSGFPLRIVSEKNGINSKEVTKYSVICALHFDKSCFFVKQHRNLLYKHVFPLVVVGRIKYVSLQ